MLFDDEYRPDGVSASFSHDASSIAHLEGAASGFVECISTHQGRSFENGLYRVHSIPDMTRWNSIVAQVFPLFRERIFCFSYDWLGRHFALDLGRQEKKQYLLLMLEPGTGQALEVPANFRDFHDRELVEFRNEALASDFYRAWLASGGASPRLTECVGYKNPLFLGGQDVVANLELIDMEVYWSISAQLITKIRSLPEGTRIRDIRITD